MVKLIRLVIGIPLIVVGLLLGLVAVASYGQPNGMPVVVVLGFVSLASIVIGWKVARTRPQRHQTPQDRLEWSAGSSDGNWRDDPATERQKSFARDLGIDFPPNITKGELSDLISEETGR